MRPAEASRRILGTPVSGLTPIQPGEDDEPSPLQGSSPKPKGTDRAKPVELHRATFMHKCKRLRQWTISGNPFADRNFRREGIGTMRNWPWSLGSAGGFTSRARESSPQSGGPASPEPRESARPANEPKRRRSDRILVPLRIHVTGLDARSEPFEEDSITISVNKHGACISLQHQVVPEQKLTIKNLENGIATDFRVVGELRQVFGSRREWGVETLCPECNIWGLDFALPPEGAQPKVLICCAVCKDGALSTISSIEYDVLLYTGVISRHCERCGQTTRWEPSGHSPEPELIARAVKPVPGPLERRRHRRLKLTMLVRVRNAKGESEIVQTLDVSKGGVCFVSQREYVVGELLLLTLPSTDKPAPLEATGRVVRAQSTPRGKVYGIMFEKA
jgi:hypothetical protein